MSRYRGAGRADRDQVATVLDKAWNYPAAGLHIGGGDHVPMPAVWDGIGPVPVGWSSFQAHRTSEDEAVFMPESETGSKLARLTPQEQAQLAAARAAAVPELPAEPTTKEAR